MATSLRDTILDAAVGHVAEHGPDTLSFRQLATDAGVSHQAPYHHFSDRRGIFRAIALDGFNQLAQVMSSVEYDSVDSLSEELLIAYVEFALDHPGHFRVMFRRDLCEMEDGSPLADSAEGAFNALVNHVNTLLAPDAPIATIRARSTAMWSLAHRLATLLIEGPLEKKVGPIKNRREFIRSVAQQSGL